MFWLKKHHCMQVDALRRDVQELELAIGALRVHNKELKSENLELCYNIEDVQKENVLMKAKVCTPA